MAATTQLIVRLEPIEKQAIVRAAHRSHRNISEYVRSRLLDVEADDPDQALLQVLAELRPVVDQAVTTIDENLARIRRLRTSTADREIDEQAEAERARRELTGDELTAVADRLQLSDSDVSAEPAATR